MGVFGVACLELTAKALMFQLNKTTGITKSTERTELRINEVKVKVFCYKPEVALGVPGG
jgi:hypothetical protein